ncbi:MAG: hypothetical protein IJ682_09665 [Lachnospiraceae bacterium]|nr:hypothetical protein [Lachnospiraceae bacterium]
MGSNNQIKKLVKILVILAGISVAFCFVSIMVYLHKEKDDVAELLDLGQTFLEDGKYEQAVASLEVILSIDPKEAKTEEERKVLEDKDAIFAQLADAYLAWADDEEKKGNGDYAQEIRDRGFEKTGDERLDLISADDNNPNSYKDKVIKAYEKYLIENDCENFRLVDLGDEEKPILLADGMKLDFGTGEDIGYNSVDIVLYDEPGNYAYKLKTLGAGASSGDVLGYKKGSLYTKGQYSAHSVEKVMIDKDTILYEGIIDEMLSPEVTFHRFKGVETLTDYTEMVEEYVGGEAYRNLSAEQYDNLLEMYENIEENREKYLRMDVW